jgi:hypothetical protein
MRKTIKPFWYIGFQQMTFTADKKVGVFHCGEGGKMVSVFFLMWQRQKKIILLNF